MRMLVKLDLDLVESWLTNVTAENEKQRSFLETIEKCCKEIRNTEELDIVLDIELDDGADYVLSRFKDGEEILATPNEVYTYYAQCIAKGKYTLDQLSGN